MKKLTAKTFLLLLILSLAVLLFAYGCIWIFLPYANRKQSQKEFEEKTEQLVITLRTTQKHNSEALFLNFIQETSADVYLFNKYDICVSIFTFQEIPFSLSVNQPRTAENRHPFRFADSDEDYILITYYNPARSDEIIAAMRKSIPYVTIIILLLSSMSAFLFSHYTTRPILRIGKIADKIANLDFSWYCPDVRNDEIGMLSKSINELSDKLHEALDEISNRNAMLEDEIMLEKERERRRMLFFSGISHELKTPIAIVIGQLEGMQANIGVYKDHEKYLARSIELMQSLNSFIREVLLISHIDMQTLAAEPVNLSHILDCLICDYTEYAELSSIDIEQEIEKDIFIYGEEALLKKALGNIIGNAVAHSPKHAKITITLSRCKNSIAGHATELKVTNSPAHIDEEHLSHVFEAFYRANQSSDYGSGLGLYITRMILETYHIPHTIENTKDGVQFTTTFF